MPSKLERLLILPDTHVPKHSERAWQLVMSVAKDFKPEILVHLGDLADFEALSSHPKDPQGRKKFKAEVEKVRDKRKEMDDLKPKRKVFIEGNHSYRLIRYLQDKAPEFIGITDLDELLGLSENNWEHVPYRDHIKIGKLFFTHDVGAGGKYSTARALETFQHSVCVGHNHAMQYFVQGDATGKHQVGAQFGWLGDVSKAGYMHKIKAKRSWSLGFGLGYLDPATQYVYLQPVPLVNFSCVVEGKLYKG